MVHLHNGDFYSAVKKHTRKFEEKWIELEKDIILSVIIHTEKDKDGVYLQLILAVKEKNNHGTIHSPRVAR